MGDIFVLISCMSLSSNIISSDSKFSFFQSPNLALQAKTRKTRNESKIILLKKTVIENLFFHFLLLLLLFLFTTAFKHKTRETQLVKINHFCFVHYFFPLTLNNASLQIFCNVDLLFEQRFVVGHADEGDGAFGERVLVVPPPDRESLPVVAERLKQDDSLAEAVVELLTRAVALGRRLGRSSVTGNAFSAGLDDVSVESDVDLALLVDLYEVAPADFDEIFLEFERIHRPVRLADAQHANVSCRR